VSRLVSPDKSCHHHVGALSLYCRNYFLISSLIYPTLLSLFLLKPGPRIDRNHYLHFVSFLPAAAVATFKILAGLRGSAPPEA
jgi:hypothetical protein